jgi:hypothetical protein
MRKRELLKRLRHMARASGTDLQFLREGGNHEIWVLGGQRLVIRRHSDINERTVQAILELAQEVTRD